MCALNSPAVLVVPSGGLAVESFPVWTDHVLDLPIWSSRASSQRSLGLKWTMLNSARLTFTVQAEVWPSWAALYINGSKVRDFDFRLGGGTVTNTVDVTSLVVQGINVFLFDANKVAWAGFGIIRITVNLTLDGEYEPPAPPIPPISELLQNPYVLAGIGLGAMGLIILVARRRKPEVVYVSPQPAARYRRARNRGR